MITINKHFPAGIKQVLVENLYKLKIYVKKIWIRAVIFSLIALIINQKEFSFHFTIGSANAPVVKNGYLPLCACQFPVLDFIPTHG